MSGVYIKGMEKPNSCAFCRFYGAYCYAKGDENVHSTLPCPLIPVPPHGDLIERDAAYDKIAEQEGGNYVDMDAVDKGLNETPTIIPAEDADYG